MMTNEEKYQITNQVLKELSITAKTFYPKDTVLTVGLVVKLAEESLNKVIAQNDAEMEMNDEFDPTVL